MEPSTQDLAKLAELTYGNNKPDIDYTRIQDLSTDDIHTFKHNSNPHYVISHRGTNLVGDGKKVQLKADMNILKGNQDGDPLHRKRVRDTENIIRKIKQDDPEHDVYLTGHSLGASTAQHALIKSKYTRDNVKKFETFNAGSSPLYKIHLNKKNQVYKDIYDKSTHHVITGDGISQNAKNNMIGKIKTYNTKTKPTLKTKLWNFLKPFAMTSPITHLAHWSVDKFKDTLINHSISNFTK